MKEDLQKLQDSEKFKTWQKDHKDCFLIYAFLMKGHVKEEWQFGYYNPKTDKVTAFAVSDIITLNPESEMFKNDIVRKLDMEKVKISFDEAFKIVEGIKKIDYPHFKTMQTMVILQNLELGQTWNITLIPADYKVLNVKIDCENGEVLKQGLIELFNLEK